jgi:type IV pilus biogenesis protein PilP
MSNEHAHPWSVRRYGILIVLAGAACAGWPPSRAAAADAAPVAAVVPTAAAVGAANQLMQLQEDTMVLKAQLKKLDAQAQVAEREASLNQMGRSSANTQMTLVATQSLGRDSSATVLTADGSELDVHAGDALPDGARVVSIGTGAMIVQAQGGRRMTLMVASVHGSGARLAATAAPQGVVPSIPALPVPAR